MDSLFEQMSAEYSSMDLKALPEERRRPYVVLEVMARDACARPLGRLRCVCRPGPDSTYVWEKETAPDALGGERWLSVSVHEVLVEILVRALAARRLRSSDPR